MLNEENGLIGTVHQTSTGSPKLSALEVRPALDRNELALPPIWLSTSETKADRYLSAICAYRTRFRSSLGEANKSMATKKILPSGLSKNRQAMFIPTLAPNQGVWHFPVTLI